MRTGVPGVWEEVANGIKERTEQDKPAEVGMELASKGVKTRKVTSSKEIATKEERKRTVITGVKRQTARPHLKPR